MIQDTIRARRSIKKLLPEEIRPETLEALLELAVHAPNHRMTEPWFFIIIGTDTRRSYGRILGDRRASRVEDSEAAAAVRAKALAEMEAVPSLVAFVQRLDPDPGIREEDFASIYMGIQNFSLGAVELGLGTHIKTGPFLDSPEARATFEVKEDERLVALVNVGTPAELPAAKPRTPAAERTRRLP